MRKIIFSVLSISVLAVLGSACKKPVDKNSGPDVLHKFFRIDKVVTNPSATYACNGQEVALTISGTVYRCTKDGTDCAKIGLFSTQPGGEAEGLPCNEIHSTVGSWVQRYSNSSNMENVGNGIFNPSECTVKLEQPIPDTFYDGRNYISYFKREVFLSMGFSGRNILGSNNVDIFCPAAP